MEDEPTEIAVAYDGAVCKIYINNKLQIEENASYLFKCNGKLDIGSYSTTTKEVFFGSIFWV